MKETQITSKFVKTLNKRFTPYAKFIVKEAKYIRGQPDIFGCVCGLTVLIEMKTENYWKNRPGHALQLEEQRKWRDSGARVCQLYSEQDRQQLILELQAVVDHFKKTKDGVGTSQDTSDPKAPIPLHPHK